MSIKVFIVAGSAVNRAFLREAFTRANGYELLGSASTPLIALKRLLKQEPDLIICDYDTSAMTGLEFIEYLQRNRKAQCILLLPEYVPNNHIKQQALRSGAIACLIKPNFFDAKQAESFRAQLFLLIDTYFKPPQEKTEKPDISKKVDIIAIGSSTGGTALIERLLSQLGANSPCVLIVQHMPEKFTKSFAQRLNSLVEIEVKEAADGDVLQPGLALIAAGGKHLAVVSHAGQLRAHVYQGQLQQHHMPSVDVLYESIAKLGVLSVYALLLTGMGKDGAEGMLQLKNQGAFTIALSEEDCVVYGMPRAAKNLGAVTEEMGIEQLERELSLLVST